MLSKEEGHELLFSFIHSLKDLVPIDPLHYLDMCIIQIRTLISLFSHHYLEAYKIFHSFQSVLFLP